MKLNYGPIKSAREKIAIRSRISSMQALFALVFIALPILIYLPFQFGWIRGGPPVPSKLSSGVAKTTIGAISGSAFLVTDQYLVTAAHVVDAVGKGGSVQIDFEKANEGHLGLNATVVFCPIDSSGMRDYAVLKLDKPISDITPLVIGSARNCSIGENIRLVGYPGGVFSATSGSISNNNVGGNMMQLDVGAWPGSSGGPVISDATDEVVGILVVGYNGSFQGIVQAIHIDALLNDLEFLATGIQLRL